MAERRQFLDRLTPDVCKHVRQIGGDPDFVDFLLGWYGLLRMDPSVKEMASLRTKTWPYWSTSRQRQEKRKLQRRYPRTWKKKWKYIQALARSYEPPKFKGGLFSIDPQGPIPAHGPFRWNFWLALCDVMHYFTRIKKKPHWDVIAEVFFPKHGFNYPQSEWAKRKARLSGIDHERSLNRMLSFYATYKPVILEVLKHGVPMWASPHREHFERLRAEAAPETIFQTITGRCRWSAWSPSNPWRQRERTLHSRHGAGRSNHRLEGAPPHGVVVQKSETRTLSGSFLRVCQVVCEQQPGRFCASVKARSRSDLSAFLRSSGSFAFFGSPGGFAGPANKSDQINKRDQTNQTNRPRVARFPLVPLLSPFPPRPGPLALPIKAG